MTKTFMRFVLLVLCLVCIAAAVLPVAAAPGQAAAGQNMTTVVHNGTGRNAWIVGTMEQGTEVDVLEEKGDFLAVNCYGMTGYIRKSQLRLENETYYVNCDPESSDTRLLTYTDHADALQMRHSLLALARKQLGKPYIYGSIGTSGFDCSGLTYYLFGKHDMALNRTASQQLECGIVVPKEALQVGDLVFFREAGCRKPSSHVGIYVGNNQIIHSGNGGVAYANLDYDYFARYYYCARRIVNTNGASTDITDTAGFSGTALPAVGARRVG